eukprot:4945008-Karenia_brevis.AAC.1
MDLEGDDRVTFYQQCSEMCGKELKKYVKESVTRLLITNHTTRYSEDGEFVDEDEVDATFKDKPQQLANIKANA